MNVVHKMWKRGVERSPKDNWDLLRIKLGLAKEKPPLQVTTKEEHFNWVVSKVLEQPAYCKLLASRVAPSADPVVLLGSKKETQPLRQALAQQGREVACAELTREVAATIDRFPSSSPIIFCPAGEKPDHWRAVHELKGRFGKRVVGIQELALPLAGLQEARSRLAYFVRDLEELSDYYLGRRFYGPFEELNRVYPLAGKRVIEFGPLEGCQTAGLVHCGAESVTAVEARPDNWMKVMTACQVFGWKNVTLVSDDFHNADATKYGRFDLAFAHGVYYHSIAPFLFLENLRSLADAIFVGGYCATDRCPVGAFESLDYEGRTYRVKRYAEPDLCMSGVNAYGFYFDGGDLMRFFRERGYSVTVITDTYEKDALLSERFLRFLARKEA